MPRRREYPWLPLLLITCAAASASARPQTGAAGPGHAGRSRRPGSHFIAEINVGPELRGGLSVGGVLGFGGKLKGLPPRFYLVAELAHVTRSLEGRLPDLPLTFTEQWRFNDAAAGLRIYLPVYRHVRLLIDLMGGGSQTSGSLVRQGMNPLSVEGWHPLGQLATGLQVRPLYRLSLGVRAKIAFTGGGISTLGELAGSDLVGRRATVTGGLTWHF